MAEIEIEFLTHEDTERGLCRQYWLVGESGKFVHPVSRLSDAFDVPRSQVAKRVTGLCIAFCRDELCKSCGTPRAFASRADYEQRRRHGNWTSWACHDCREVEQAEAKRQVERQAKLRSAVITTELDAMKERGLSADGLSFVDAIYVVSLLRSGGSEDLSFVVPHESLTTPLSPTTEFDREVLNHLYREGIICIHPGSRQESVVVQDGALTRFFPFKVHWILPLPKDGPSPARFLEQVEELLKSADWPTNWEEQSKELQRVVALQECLQYLRVVLEEHGFDARLGEKTSLVLRSVLGQFSIAQAYNFIWRAARDAAAFYVRERTSKAHAANIVPGAIQRMAERAVAEGWEVKGYRRDFRAPQSQLSQVLFTTALKLPEGGFGAVPPPDEHEVEGAD